MALLVSVSLTLYKCQIQVFLNKPLAYTVICLYFMSMYTLYVVLILYCKALTTLVIVEAFLILKPIIWLLWGLEVQGTSIVCVLKCFYTDSDSIWQIRKGELKVPYH